MKKTEKYGIMLFGYIEVTIGLVTLISLAEVKIFRGITKPPGVFIFVFLTSLASLILGIGILRYKMWARKFLIFFSGYIAFTKILIFLKIMQLSGPFETLIASSVKNGASFIYHIFVISFFYNEKIRENFKATDIISNKPKGFQ